MARRTTMDLSLQTKVAQAPKCKGRPHGDPRVTPCRGTRHDGADTAPATGHLGGYRVQGTLDVREVVWFATAQANAGKDGWPRLAACYKGPCTLPSGHTGPCLPDTTPPVDTFPTPLQPGDRVMLRRGVWSDLCRVALYWSDSQVEAFFGEKPPPWVWGTHPHATGTGVKGLPIDFRRGTVLARLDTVCVVEHDTGHEVEWLPGLLMPEDAEEERDRFASDDSEYLAAVQEGNP